MKRGLPVLFSGLEAPDSRGKRRDQRRNSTASKHLRGGSSVARLSGARSKAPSFVRTSSQRGWLDVERYGLPVEEPLWASAGGYRPRAARSAASVIHAALSSRQTPSKAHVEGRGFRGHPKNIVPPHAGSPMNRVSTRAYAPRRETGRRSISPKCERLVASTPARQAARTAHR